MHLEYVPLLKMQRDLYRLPRGMDRFHEYLRTMVNDQGDDLKNDSRESMKVASI